jgi:hypothetical protein
MAGKKYKTANKGCNEILSSVPAEDDVVELMGQ